MGVMVAIGITLVAAVGWIVNETMGRVEPAAATEGLHVSLTVEPFETSDSVPAFWNAASFADSLATQLSLIRGIRATTQSARTNYVLHGHVTMKDGRLILATRLGHHGARDTVWTATFWRSATASNTVLTDLAQAVAEAMFNESAKEPFNRKREKP